MKIIIKAKNFELTDSLSAMVEKKISRLSHFIKVLDRDIEEKGKTLAEVFVEIGKETIHHRKGDIFTAEAMISLPRKKIMAKAHGEDIVKIVGEVKDELEREIQKYKTKVVELPRRKYRRMKKDMGE